MNSVSDYKYMTISIPTYNRVKDLKDNIDNIIPQVTAHKEKVRIFVSDNASTDGTADLLKRTHEAYPDIFFYYIQESNLTASPNFRYVAKTPNSDYIYLLGDDDVVLPGFIDIIFNIIERHPGVGWINFNFFLGKDGLKVCELNNKQVDYPFVKVYKNGGELVKDYLDIPSFMSSNVFKRQLWIEGIEHEKKDCPGYEWYSILLYGSLKYESIYYSLPLCVALFTTAGSNYSRLQVLYYVYGMGNLFRYYDSEVNGIYKLWTNKQQHSKIKFLQLLSTVGMDKLLYKTKASVIKPFILSKSDRLYYDICCYVPKFISVYLFNKTFRAIELGGLFFKKLISKI